MLMADLPGPILSIRLVVSVAEVVLGRGEHVLGRGVDCAVCLEDPLASRRHAVILVAADGVTIRDLDSRNGVLVNGEEIDHLHTLVEGDLIMLGSLAITVRQICRAGARAAQAVAPSVATKTAPLARIAVAKRAVMRDGAVGTGASTLGRTGSELGRPAAVYHLVAEAAARAVAAGRAERAETILEAPLLDVMTALRAGTEVEAEILGIAEQQALLLAELTGKGRWVDYVHAFYEVRRRSLPLDVADRLARIVMR
jgi:hypothetical protein